MDDWLDSCLDGWNGGMHVGLVGQTEGRKMMDGTIQLDVWMVVYLDGWMDGCRWLYTWMVG